ncbi:MAG: RagB/SusD family nutrient uptake outer membrane protein [Muribaculaceae bacterium]|nr:RagB/SusD family nutrient uptake outer membrane protein [Muribaculaceae bacterium]
MKNIYKFLLSGIILSTATACSSDYLDLKPQTSADPETMFGSPEVANYAVWGLGKIMATQYLSTQGYNGEGTIYAYNGEFPGDGIQFNNKTGWANIAKQNYNSSANTNVQFGWYYYYKLIGNANQILSYIPTEQSPEDVAGWQWVKAQALTYRAYAYTMLSQLFSRRWSDQGANGLQRGVVLRLDTSIDPMPCSTMGEVFEQIYKDLDEAISLFDECGIDREKDVDKRWMANINVAHAVYTRAALVREDWQTVVDHASKARKGYPIMGIDNYKAGFNTANQEWIWEVFNDDTQALYYYSFYNYASSSCSGSNSRTYPPSISKQIVDDIDANDSRLSIYAVPTQEEIDAVKVADRNKRLTSGKYYDRVKNEFAGRIYSTTYIFFYLSTKFIVKSGVGNGCIPIFRAAEMYYAEAEAQYHLGNETAAKAALEATVIPYNEAYTCDKSGEELFNEIKAYRKFDLCNEGHSFFDLKRWGDSMVRKTWSQGGSWISNFAGTGETGGNYGPDAKNNWTLILPNFEQNYNPLVSKVEQINPDGTWQRAGD